MDRPLFRAFSQMPFAGHHCPIPSRAQQLGHGGTIGAEMILIGGTVRGGARPGGIAVNHHANAHLADTVRSSTPRAWGNTALDCRIESAPRRSWPGGLCWAWRFPNRSSQCPNTRGHRPGLTPRWDAAALPLGVTACQQPRQCPSALIEESFFSCVAALPDLKRIHQFAVLAFTNPKSMYCSPPVLRQ